MFQIHVKEEQYELLTNKLGILKKENKDLKRQKSSLEVKMERQKLMMTEQEQIMKEKDKKIILLKDNQRNLNDKMKKLDSVYNEYEQTIQKLTDEKLRFDMHCR